MRLSPFLVPSVLAAVALAAGAPGAAHAATGPAGGVLTGNYPDPGLGANKVKGSHIAAGTIKGADVAEGSLTGFNLAFGSVMQSDLGIGAVGQFQVANNAVIARHIAPDAVTGSEIAENAVGPFELANDSVEHDEIKNGSVIAADLAPGAGSSATAVRRDNAGNVAGGGVTVLTKTLPTGSYVLMAKAELYHGGQETVAPSCDLVAGNDSDHGTLGFTASGIADRIGTVSLMLAHTFSQTGDAVLKCSAGGGTMSVSHTKIIAIKVGALSSTAG